MPNDVPPNATLDDILAELGRRLRDGGRPQQGNRFVSFLKHPATLVVLTFVLTSGGHNAGIVNEPGRKGRQFQIATRKVHDNYVGPDQWVQQAQVTEGSWWTAWVEWLAGHSDGKTAAPSMGAPDQGLRLLGDAPGTYVHQR